MDFIRAAMPWIAIGLLLAIFCARSAGKNKNKEHSDNYGTEGTSLGMCFGTAIGTSLGNNTGDAPGSRRRQQHSEGKKDANEE